MSGEADGCGSDDAAVLGACLKHMEEILLAVASHLGDVMLKEVLLTEVCGAR